MTSSTGEGGERTYFADLKCTSHLSVNTTPSRITWMIWIYRREHGPSEGRAIDLSLEPPVSGHKRIINGKFMFNISKNISTRVPVRKKRK